MNDIKKEEEFKPITKQEMHEYLIKILTADVYQVAIKTPLTLLPNLSRKLNSKIFLKREDLQPVFSYKLRGAFNKISKLPKSVRDKGIIAASAGNHAQGVTFSAQKLGCKSTIVMPTTTPNIKIDSVMSMGAEIVLYGESYSDSFAHAMKLANDKKLTLIHAFDDPDIIAGQGTVGVEVLQQYSQMMLAQTSKGENNCKIQAILLPIGGGGLASGVGMYVKQLYPNIKIIGIQAIDSDAMLQSINLKQRVNLKSVGIFADGVAIKKVGTETLRICSEVVDEIVLVSEDSLCAAIKDVFEDTRSILEPSGAMAVAGAKKWLSENKANINKGDLVAIASGANMNFERLNYIVERSTIVEDK